MEKERQEALEWFVQFANMNLDQLGPGDRAKLSIEAHEYLFPTDDDIKKFSSIDDMKIEGVPFGVLGRKMKWALSLPAKDTNDYWAVINRLQKVVRESMDFFAEQESGSWNIVATFTWRISEIKFTFDILPIIENHEKYVEFKLYKLLDGLPVTTLTRCPGCEKYFLNPSLRKKRFCSPRCMWRVNAEKRREELKEKHPGEYKAYLKKQKKIMRRKYEEKRKAELGPNVKVRKRKED